MPLMSPFMEGEVLPPMDPMAGAMGGGLVSPFPPPMGPAQREQKVIRREPPEPPEQREASVKKRLGMIEDAEKRWSADFDRMRADQDFAIGKQWPVDSHSSRATDGTVGMVEKYTVNLMQRYIRQQTAVLYAKNPTVTAARRQKLDFQIWDERPESLMEAMNAVTQAQQAMMAGMPLPPEMIAMIQQASALLQDVEQGRQRRVMLTNLGRTLELVVGHFMSEQVPDFKSHMKQAVRRAITCGVAWIKPSFQRDGSPRPDAASYLADARARLETLESMAADIADDEVDPLAAEMDELQMMIASMEEMPARRGLVWDFPPATAIIPDIFTRSLNGWIGTRTASEKFQLTAEQIQEIYKVDIASSATPVAGGASGQQEGWGSDSGKKKELYDVFHMYDRRTGLVYPLCRGYADYLAEPYQPEIDVEQFFPWTALTFNEHEHERDIFPRSDVRTLRSIQMEYNRTRESLRQHRIANRPLYAGAEGALEEEDEKSLAAHQAHDVIKIKGLAQGQKITDKFQPVQKVPIDPAAYEVNGLFEDFMRASGAQEANLGGTSGATATEASVAETSRMSAIGSSGDELDEALSRVMRISGQVALQELTLEEVQDIAGPGAVWPDMDRDQIMREVWLEVEAGSAGRPNAEQEVAKLERMIPLLVQLPNINPLWLARHTIKTMNAKVDLTDAILEGAPSLQAMNSAAQPSTGDPATDPNAQGAQGADNKRKPPEGPGGPQPAFPAPQAAGAGYLPGPQGGAPGGAGPPR